MDFLTGEIFLVFFTLTALEIVFGLDNVVFIAILVNHLPPERRQKARLIGLSLAAILRILMLLGAAWIIKLTQPLFILYSFEFSGRTLMLIAGGLFLIIKSGFELYEMINEQPYDAAKGNNAKQGSYNKIISQIIFVDVILSFDSIITAVAMTDNIPVIILAILIAIGVMLLAAKPLGEFINKHPSIKVIALFFIGLVGIMLLFKGLNLDFPKSYLYVTLFFSLACETVNILIQDRNKR